MLTIVMLYMVPAAVPKPVIVIISAGQPSQNITIRIIDVVRMAESRASDLTLTYSPTANATNKIVAE
jgi:hypothetical protein